MNFFSFFKIYGIGIGFPIALSVLIKCFGGTTSPIEVKNNPISLIVGHFYCLSQYIFCLFFLRLFVFMDILWHVSLLLQLLILSPSLGSSGFLLFMDS